MATTSQMVHCEVIQLGTQKQFHFTVVYGSNKEELRRPLWHDLKVISQQTLGVWCVVGDFNAVLCPQDRIGGDDIQDSEVKDFTECINAREITEMQSSGHFFSWSNRGRNGKRIWSRIDKVFSNLEL